MTDADTVTNDELAIFSDFVAGWSLKQVENLDADKRLALDHLIANGFVEEAKEHSVTKYQHTAKTELLFTQLCVGLSGAVSLR
jgi:hypothetical protein